jgi:flagellar biosynthesis protein FliQ
MTGAELLESTKDALTTAVIICAAPLIVGTLVGIAISLFQALTQIQEQTLLFGPKIVATFVTFLVALPFMAETLNGFFLRMASLIALQR